MPEPIPLKTVSASNGTARLFGILHVVFASVIILTTLVSLVAAPVMKINGQEPPNPLRDQLGPNGYVAWMAVTTAIGVGWMILLLIAGIYLLKGLDKGRRLSNVWAPGSTIIGTTFTLLSVFWITPMIWKAQQRMDATDPAQPHPGPGFYETMKWVMGGMQLVVGLAMAWVYQALTLVKLNKPEVKAHLR